MDNVADMMNAVNILLGFPFFNCKKTFLAYISALTRMNVSDIDQDLLTTCNYTLSQIDGIFLKFEVDEVS